MGDRVLGLGEGLFLRCTHPSLCSPEGQRIRRKPDLSIDLCIGLGLLQTNRSGWRYLIWGVQAGGNLPLATPRPQPVPHGPRARAGGALSRFLSQPWHRASPSHPHPQTGLLTLSAGGHTAASHPVRFGMSLQAVHWESRERRVCGRRRGSEGEGLPCAPLAVRRRPPGEGGRGGAWGGAAGLVEPGLGPQLLSRSAAHPASPPVRPPLQPPGSPPCGAGLSSCWLPQAPRLRSPCPRRRPTWPFGPRHLLLPRGRPASGPLLAGRAASPGRLSPGRALPVSAAAAQSTWGC